jgi:hypothetical protein
MKCFDKNIIHEGGKMNSSPDPENQCNECGKAEDKSFPDPVNDQEPEDAEDDDVKIIHGSLLQP